MSDRTAGNHRETTRRRAEAVYMEMPGLTLTPAQASRLWRLDMDATIDILDQLVREEILFPTKDGAYLMLAR